MPWASPERVQVVYGRREVHLTAERSKVDLAAMDRALRKAGYPARVIEPDPLPPDLAGAPPAVPPGARFVKLQIAGWTKTRGCRPGGPTPEAVRGALEAVKGVLWVELDRAEDRITVVTDAGGPEPAALVKTLEALGCTAGPPAAPGPLPESLKKALEEARRDRKRVLLQFSSPTCAVCQRMKKESWPDPRVAGALKSYVVLAVDPRESPELAARFRVSEIPQLRILDADETELEQRTGFLSADELAQLLAARKGGS